MAGFLSTLKRLGVTPEAIAALVRGNNKGVTTGGPGVSVTSGTDIGTSIGLSIVPTARRSVWLHAQVSSNVTSQGGRYFGKTLKQKYDRFATTANLANADIGTAATQEDCVIWNPNEVNVATHNIPLNAVITGELIGYTLQSSTIRAGLPVLLMPYAATSPIGTPTAIYQVLTCINATTLQYDWDYVRSHS